MGTEVKVPLCGGVAFATANVGVVLYLTPISLYLQQSTQLYDMENHLFKQKPTNKLIHGDCLEVMKKMEPESIDLIYLDPPFFSNRNYEVI